MDNVDIMLFARFIFIILFIGLIAYPKGYIDWILPNRFKRNKK